jgi:hypothetical protein
MSVIQLTRSTLHCHFGAPAPSVLSVGAASTALYLCTIASGLAGSENGELGGLSRRGSLQPLFGGIRRPAAHTDDNRGFRSANPPFDRLAVGEFYNA